MARVKRTSLFTDSWAHCSRPPRCSINASRYWDLYHSHKQEDVPKLHAKYWGMVSAELRDKQYTRLFKVV